MKSKKNRKPFRDPSPRPNSQNNHTLKLFQVKFDLSTNDISCFFNKTRASRQKNLRVKHNPSLQKKQSPVLKNEQPISKPADKKKEAGKERGESPDLIRQSSNTILEKIQQKGIRFDWNEGQQGTKEVIESPQNDENETIWSAFDSSFQKSYASTNDYPIFQSSNYYWKTQKESQSTFSENPFSVQLDYICFDWRTTLMIRNIPNRYTVNELAEQIDSGHADTYDFLYLPCDPKNLCNVGYGFINFLSNEHLRSFYLKFNQYVWKRYRSQKICSLTYARLQGLSQLIEHFSNSKVLTQKQKKYRPIIKMEEIHKMVLEQQRK